VPQNRINFGSCALSWCW